MYWQELAHNHSVKLCVQAVHKRLHHLACLLSVKHIGEVDVEVSLKPKDVIFTSMQHLLATQAPEIHVYLQAPEESCAEQNLSNYTNSCNSRSGASKAPAP